MALLSITYGVILILLGAEGYYNTIGLFGVTELHAPTALIPAGFGAVLVVCGLLAVKASIRMHVMHVAALVGVLGTLGGLGMGGPKVPALLNGTAERPSAVKLQVTMGVVCLLFVIMCVKSFIDARRRRKLAGR
jgi:hypothetical protein